MPTSTPVVGVAAIPALIVDRPTASSPLLIAPASILPEGRLSRASTMGPGGATAAKAAA